MPAKSKKNVAPSSETKTLWEEVPCNLCGSEKFHVKYRGTTDSDSEKLLKSFHASGNFVSQETIVECEECGLVYTSPRLRQDIILKGYTENEDETYVSQAKGRINTFEKSVKAIEKYAEPGKILDVGAAAGFFLKAAKDKGWTTYGIEPSKYLSDWGNKQYDVNIKRGTLDSVKSFDGPMDVVTLWDVLEHTLDPKAALQQCNRLLAKGGLVVINYPNIGNWMARLAGRRYWFILTVHLYYFVPETIEHMLQETGFEVVDHAPHFQTLELGYLLYRLEAYLPGPAQFMGKIAKALGVSQWLIPYYAAQSRVMAAKVQEG